MVFVRPIKLNVSCKLHPYSLKRTRSPPGPCLPKKIRNTHPHNYYELKSKDIDVYIYIYIYIYILNSIHNIIPLLKKEKVFSSYRPVII